MADFGIALAVSTGRRRARITETGIAVGTPHYMSPEQATGEREITGRSDVYSLASVAYEMLTGDPPHTGATAQQIILGIVADEARPVAEMRKAVPTNVAAALAKGLEKLPADRFTTAEAFSAALADPGFRHGDMASTDHGGGGIPRSRAATVLPWAIAAAAVLMAIWAAGFSGGRGTAGAMSDYLGIPLPDSALVPLRPLAPLGIARNTLAVPSHGLFLVYTGYDGQVSRLYRRDMDSFDPVPIPGTEGASNPFFSPDDEWIGFFSGTQIKKVSVRGGEPQVITEAANAYGGFWSEDDEILFSANEGVRVLGVSAAGGEPRYVTDPDLVGDWWFANPRPLPGSDAILATGATRFTWSLSTRPPGNRRS